VDVEPGSWLPVDDSGYGFDNIAEVLTTSPVLLERYMTAARRIARWAVGDLTVTPGEDIYTPPADPGALRTSLPFTTRNGVAVEHYFPVDAEYEIDLRFTTDPGPNDRADFVFRTFVPAGLHVIGAGSRLDNLRPEPAGRGAGGRGGAAVGG